MAEIASLRVLFQWKVLHRVTNLSFLLYLKPFDTSTECSRSRERYRRILLTALASASAKSIVAATTLISVPLTLGYLGHERYGMWMTMISIIAMLGFADLGVSNGLLNAVAEADGKNDREAACRYVSSGIFVLTAIGILILAIFTLAFPFVNWPRVFNVTSELAVREAGPTIAVFMAYLAVSIPLSVVDRVQLGYQSGFANSLWGASGNLLGLAGVLLAIHLRLGLPWLVLAMAGAPILASLANAIVLFRIQRPWLRPSLAALSGSAVIRLLKLGALFFTLQVSMTIAYASDNVIAAWLLGPAAVTEYAVPARMFSIVPLLLSLALNPLWPAYRESFTRGDLSWVRKTFFQSLFWSLITSVPLSFILVIFGIPIIHYWVGPTITPSLPLLLGLGTWSILASGGGALAMFLNGAGVIRFQVLCALLLLSTVICLKIFMTYALGISGIIWSTVIAQITCVTVPSSVYIFKLLAKLRRDELGILIVDK